MRAALLIAVAACGSTPPATRQEQAAPVPEHPARSTPAPTIEFADNAFHARGLPAVARAGEVAVVAVSDSDGGRGYPNLHVEVRDREDKVLETHSVLSADEYARLAQGGRATPSLDERIAKVNHALATLHGLHDLVMMRKLEAVPPAGEDLQHMCTGDGFDVDFRSGQLAVFRHNSQRPLVAREATGWEAPPRTAAGEPCTNPSFLAAAYHARGINTMVVVIGFRGTDLCWEPGDEYHVVTW